MSVTSPGFLRLIPPILVLLAALACPASAEDIQTLIGKAKDGNPKAQYQLGNTYYFGEGIQHDYTEAVKWYRKAADQGYAGAQYNLGVAYHSGQGVPQDYGEALKWYRKAADQGYAIAQYNLGVAYRFGQGVPQDYGEAVKWFREAADQGHSGAQYNLGVAYENGRGVPQDFSLAYLWFSLSASKSTDKDYNRRKSSRDDTARKLTPEQLTKVQQMTREWEAKHPR